MEWEKKTFILFGTKIHVHRSCVYHFSCCALKGILNENEEKNQMARGSDCKKREENEQNHKVFYGLYSMLLFSYDLKPNDKVDLFVR